MEVVIERGVPIPPPRNPATTVAGIVRALSVGDSVAFPVRSRAAAISATQYVSQQAGGQRKFIVRTVDDGMRVRVWRTT